jgi:hypothetical protein
LFNESDSDDDTFKKKATKKTEISKQSINTQNTVPNNQPLIPTKTIGNDNGGSKGVTLLSGTNNNSAKIINNV